MLLRVRLEVQRTWLAPACMLKANRLHSCNNTNEEGGRLSDLKQRHVNVAADLSMDALDMDSGS